MGGVIFTVGHSTLELDRFVALLEHAGIGAVADVRRHPGSRRLPWFGAEALAARLAAAAVGYTHRPELGGRRSRVPGSPNGGWDNAAFQGYADWMASTEFAAGLARLERTASTAPTAVMCAEAQWWRCHRRLLADALLARGWRVRHVMPPGRITDHELTPFAVVVDGRVTYPPQQLSLPG
jgi:uncharacterized protein (DUF488 family)